MSRTPLAAVAPSQTYETAAPEFVEPEPDDGALHTLHRARDPQTDEPEHVER